MNSQCFFILGCQRSGTTLMRLILDSHSEIHCYDETKSYQILQKYGTKFPKNITNKNELIGFKVLGYTEQMNNSTLIEPVNNTEIPNLYSNEKIIFMYRDVRDVISSMKNYIQKNNQSWLDNWIVPTINFWEKNIPEFKTKYSYDLKIAEESHDKKISYAAIYWKFKTNSMLVYEKKNLKILKIKYEDLVSSSISTISKITNFLEVSYQNSLLQHHLKNHAEVNETGITVGLNDAKKEIHNNSINSYKKILSFDEQEDILKITGSIMHSLSYTSK